MAAHKVFRTRCRFGCLAIFILLIAWLRSEESFWRSRSNLTDAARTGRFKAAKKAEAAKKKAEKDAAKKGDGEADAEALASDMANLKSGGRLVADSTLSLPSHESIDLDDGPQKESYAEALASDMANLKSGGLVVADSTLSLPSHESIDLDDGPQKESCRAGKGSPNSKCTERLKARNPCKWYEEVGSFLRQEDKRQAWFERRALRPCKSKPKLVMNEFPSPVCTKQSYLKDTDVLLCDSWSHEDRTLASAQRLWYQQVGVWEVFRQAYYNSKDHRAENGRLLCSKGQPRMNVLEYGSGIAPFSDFLLTRCPQVVGGITILDVAADHFYFALWRLRYKLDVLVGNAASLSGIEVSSFDVELPENVYDLVVIITVFEHLPNPLATAKKVFAALSPDGPGLVYEDFCSPELEKGELASSVQADTSDPNLGVARAERKATLELFHMTCTLLDGDMGECSKRLWQCARVI